MSVEPVTSRRGEAPASRTRRAVLRLSGAAGPKLLLAILLALCLSEAPPLALMALGFELPECQGDCGHALDTDCPPGCTTGPCAKYPAAVLVAGVPALKVPPVEKDGLLREQNAPRGPGGERPFRPPRS